METTTMNKQSLKPCPICGSKNICLDNKLKDGWVDCMDCQTEAPFNVWQGLRLAYGDGVDTSQEFETGVRVALASSMKKGMSVANAIGILALLQIEISQAFAQMCQKGGE
jgi:transcription elongation factor Elf1